MKACVPLSLDGERIFTLYFSGENMVRVKGTYFLDYRSKGLPQMSSPLPNIGSIGLKQSNDLTRFEVNVNVHESRMRREPRHCAHFPD
jgi:hypothetical protein